MDEKEERSSSSGSFSATGIFLVVVGVALVFVPFFLPNLFVSTIIAGQFDTVSSLQLTDPVNTGLFKKTTRSGDTKPSSDATFQALFILGVAGLKNTDKLVDFVKKLHGTAFDKNTKNIYQGLMMLKFTSQFTKDIADKYYNILLQLAEPHSAFRLDHAHAASLSATYYAFKAISLLGKMDDFKASRSTEYQSALHFVRLMRDQKSGGYRDAAGKNATVSSSFHAVNILLESGASVDDVFKLAGEGDASLDTFLAGCQASDGGFANSWAESRSSAVTSIQALHLASLLRSVLPLQRVNLYAATSYLRACISLHHGVAQSDVGDFDLEANYFFAVLVRAFPGLQYGTPRWLEVSLVAGGISLALFGIFSCVRSMIPGLNSKELNRSLCLSAILLTAGCAFMLVSPPVAIFAYLILATYVSIEGFEMVEADLVQPYTAGYGAGYGAAHLLLFLGMSFVVPVAFPQLAGLYALVLWAVPMSVLAAYVGCYVAGKNCLKRFMNGAFLGWAGSMAVEFAMLYARGDLAEVVRLASVRGHLFSVFVLAPLVTLLLSYVFTSVGCLVYGQGKKHSS